MDVQRPLRLVSIVVPFLGGRDLLEQCLSSVAAQTHKNLEVVIVDNGSREPLLDGVSSERFRYKLVRNSSNLGFSEAVNTGLRNSSGEFLLVLNVDAVLESSYIERCIAELCSHPEAAGASGKLLKMSDATRIDSAGHLLLADRRVRDRGEWERDRGKYDIAEEVFGFPATAAVYRKSALNELEELDGEVFDSDFFAYGEDVDLCWRLRLRGWTLRYVPGAVARHERAASGEATPTRVVSLDLRNRYLTMVKNDTLPSVLRHLHHIALTELRLLVHFLLRRPHVPFVVWWGFFRRLPSVLAKRRRIQESRKVDWRELEEWFLPYEYWATLGRWRPASYRVT